METWRTFRLSNVKISRNRRKIAEISFSTRKSGQGIKCRSQNYHRKLTNSRFRMLCDSMAIKCYED